MPGGCLLHCNFRFTKAILPENQIGWLQVQRRESVQIRSVVRNMRLRESEHRLLLLGIALAAISYLYSRQNSASLREAFTVEQAVVDAWDQIIALPTLQFRRIIVGINCNVDVIVSGTELLNLLKATPTDGKDHETLETVDQIQETFAHFFSQGAPAERYTSNPTVLDGVFSAADKELHHQIEYAIGGNAALMAQQLAAGFPRTEVLLVGPIGPRSKALLHPRITTHNSTKISRDEMHLIMEFRQGEIWGDLVAPTNSRFITSRDSFSSSAIVIDMFFNSIATRKPDLVIFSGMHLLEAQPKEMWQEKLRVIKRGVGQLTPTIPIHLELASMADKEFARNLLHRVIANVDSLGLNEQELAFLSLVEHGPYANHYPVRAGTIHVHKAVEIIHWLLSNFGYEKSSNGKQATFRLQRVHLHTLTYHLIASKGSDWSNLAAAVAAGARQAGRQACGLHANAEDNNGLLEFRTSSNFLLDKELGRVYRFQPHNPLASWMRQETVFIFTPVLVCKHPIKTVGLGDAISATGLAYSQFYRLGMKS